MSFSGSGSAWGNSGWSESFSGGSHYDDDNNNGPEGTHNASCIAGSSGWCGSSWMQSNYDERCSGCRHDRACSTWGSCNNGGGGHGIGDVLALVGGAYVAKKSIWG